MSSPLAQIIGYLNDTTAYKYYGLAATTILFYEYFMMLPDEIQYAWSSDKTWVFYLFLLNRYVPMVYQIWFLTVSYQPDASERPCEKAPFTISVLTFVTCTFIAQIVLTLRLYAVTGKSKPIGVTFTVITASQLGLGIYLVFLAATQVVQTFPPVPVGDFKICIWSSHRTIEIAYTGISLLYDLLAFLIILYQVNWSRARQYGVPGLLGTIVRDATKYFLVIFTAQFVLAITLLFGRPSIQLLPATGNCVYLPVMITRLMISLRKAARSHESPWTMGESAINSNYSRGIRSMRFASSRGASNRRDDDILLSQISSGV